MLKMFKYVYAHITYLTRVQNARDIIIIISGFI